MSGRLTESANSGSRPCALARVDGVKPAEVRRIEVSVIEHEALFLEKWHEHNQS